MPRPEDIPIIRDFFIDLTPEQLDGIPIFGDVWRGQNAVVEFYEFGCFPPYEVWLRTLLPALGEFIFGLLSFGYGDILRGYFRPNSIRGLSRLNRSKLKRAGSKANARAGGKSRFTIPEVGNEIGKRLPASDFFRGRKVTNTEMYFWRIDGVIQRGLWYWLVADLTADFLVNWTTAIMESEECSPKGTFALGIHVNNENFTNVGVWRFSASWALDYEDPPDFWEGGSIIVIPDGQQAVITVTSKFKQFNGTPMGGQVGIFQSPNFLTPIASSGWPPEATDDTEEISLFATGITGRVGIMFMVEGPPGFGSFYEGRVRVQEYHPPAD